MAGEYSRELSAKVFIGQCRLIELGFRQGGAPGFGLRRMLRDQGGGEKGMLSRGEQKSFQTDRVVLVLGPNEEVEIVWWMYQLFAEEHKGESEIAALLNSRGIRSDVGRRRPEPPRPVLCHPATVTECQRVAFGATVFVGPNSREDFNGAALWRKCR